MGILNRIAKIRFKYALVAALVISFGAAILFPGIGPDPVIEMMLVFIGILFGIVVGFFISDLYARFQSIKENAATDSSGLGTYFSFAKLMVRGRQNRKWLENTRDIINRYVRKFMPLPWEEYSKTEKEFNELMDSLKELEYKTDKENETYSNMLATLSGISDAREKLVMNGTDHLTKAEWTVVFLLGALLLFSLFYVKTMAFISIMFTGFLASAILILLLVIKDLSNLNFGESSVSIEPYERVLDTIGKPRYYKKK